MAKKQDSFYYENFSQCVACACQAAHYLEAVSYTHLDVYKRQALVQEAQRRGAEYISLEVRPSNRPAVGLYTKLGFMEEGRRRNFYSCLLYTSRCV